MEHLNKSYLRNILLNIRNDLSQQYVIENSRKIIEKLKSTEQYSKSKTIFCYASYNNEVDTIEFIKDSIKSKKIYIPRIIARSSMVPCHIKDLDNLTKNDFGILEPSSNENVIADINDIDIVIVPGIGFDINGNRLGYGCGYYDRFFKSINSDIIKIGLSFECQLVDNIPIDDFDVKLDMIITENRIIGGRNE